MKIIKGTIIAAKGASNHLWIQHFLLGNRVIVKRWFSFVSEALEVSS